MAGEGLVRQRTVAAEAAEAVLMVVSVLVEQLLDTAPVSGRMKADPRLITPNVDGVSILPETAGTFYEELNFWTYDNPPKLSTM